MVVVTLGRRSWHAAPGQQLTFGRGRDRDIRFGHEPEDDLVSRAAGTLSVLKDSVLVRNQSQSQDLILQPMPGPEMRVPVQAAVGTFRLGVVRLVARGRHDTQYVLIIDSRGLAPLSGAPDSPQGPPAVDLVGKTRTAPARLTAREKRFLSALCEPMLIYAGDEAVPASYKEIAARVGGAPSSVRNCLDALRHRLSEAEGIPGLRGDGGVEGVRSYLAALADWAIRSGVVTVADLALLGPRQRC